VYHVAKETSELEALAEYVRRAFHLLEALRERLFQITVGSFPSETPIVFAKQLLQLVEALETKLTWDYRTALKHFETEEVPVANPRAMERLRMRISTTAAIAARITPMIKFIDGARAENNPWGLVEQFERLCRAVVPESEVLIRPRWEYNYSFYPITSILKRILNLAIQIDPKLYNALRAIVDRFPSFYSLAFPPSEMTNVLQIASWAHEISHFVDKVEGERLSGQVELFLSDSLGSQVEIRVTPEELDQLKDALTESSDQLPDEIDLNQFANDIAGPLTAIVRGWAGEIFADLLSIYIFGPAALMAFCEFAVTTSLSIDQILDREHPPPRIRLRIMLNELRTWGSEFDWIGSLPVDERNAVKAYLKWMEELIRGPARIRTVSRTPEASEFVDNLLLQLVGRKVNDVVKPIRAWVRKFVNASKGRDCFLEASDLEEIATRVELLGNELPPNRFAFEGATGKAFTFKELGELLVAGWVYWIAHRPRLIPVSSPLLVRSREAYQRTNNLLLKAIESSEAMEWFSEHSTASPDVISLRPSAGRSVPRGLDREETGPLGLGAVERSWISENLNVDPREGLIVTPMIDFESQVGPASIDVRLGNDFIITRRTSIAAFDAADAEADRRVLEYQNHLYVPFGSSLVIHPGELVLGGTLEYISVPKGLVGLVVGRSSWGRVGLIIATATKVDPKFKGVLTLELVNQGSVPIRLYPGTRIAQLLFHRIGGG